MNEQNIHAPLAPSAASRWLTCPGSIAAIAALPKPPDNDAAVRGRFIHEVAEKRLRYTAVNNADVPGWVSKAELKDYVKIADDYRSYINTLGIEDGAELFVELSVDTGVEDCYGTADAVIISPDGKRIDVVDLKTGRIPVSPKDNPQLAIYALGAVRALDMMGYDAEGIVTVGLHIYQPVQGGGVAVETDLFELAAWQEGILKPAAKAVKETPDLRVPSEDGCRYCPARMDCPEYTANNLTQMREAFGAVSPLTEEDAETVSDAFDAIDAAHAGGDNARMDKNTAVATAFAALPALKRWIDDIEAQALHIMMEGEAVDGLKLVRKNTKRRWIPGKDASVARLLGAKQAYTKTLITPAQAEKLITSDKAASLAKLWEIPLGAAQVAPESDKRQGMAPEVFKG